LRNIRRKARATMTNKDKAVLKDGAMRQPSGAGYECLFLTNSVFRPVGTPKY
jgi:hypothetical protein